ncbi:ABC transporter permease [Paenibacillus gorillae]|uniref:ABC transporter permease n=1 Tax=Paenibacillus gorillae TaxID=1243662 RepID=UPI0004B5CEA4|nr:ABC-2 family transporter protein [Paenibacillus gorillae]
MMKKINKYLYSFKIGLQNSLEYRFDFFLSIVASMFPVVVQFFVWQAVYTNSSETVINGYTFSGLMLYLVLASVVSKFVSSGFEYEIASDIKNGYLSRFIIMPISYLNYRIFRFFGQKLIHFIISLIVLFVSVTTLHGILSFDLVYGRLFIFFLVLILAVILNFMIFYALSTVSFWLIEIWGVIISSRLVINIASGGLLPLAVLGKHTESILNFFPFKYTIFFPISILLDEVSIRQVIFGILIQIFWIILIFILARIMWGLGMKKYISAGG